MLRNMMDYIRFNCIRNEKGQGLVEYALIIVLVAVVVAGSLTLLKTDLVGAFKTITDAL